MIGDEMRVRQILMNLLGNAIKFTEQAAWRLTLAPRARRGARAGGVQTHAPLRRARYRTRACRSNAIDRIFAEFEQAESGPARRHGGTGLGLAISKRLIDEMGGSIAVASVPGAGATFTVDLPFAVPAKRGELGASWPRPMRGRERAARAGGRRSKRASSAICWWRWGCGRPRAAEGCRADRIGAAATGFPFTALLTDRGAVRAGRRAADRLAGDGARARTAAAAPW